MKTLIDVSIKIITGILIVALSMSIYFAITGHKDDTEPSEPTESITENIDTTVTENTEVPETE